jgi:hypothetical protein
MKALLSPRQLAARTGIPTTDVLRLLREHNVRPLGRDGVTRLYGSGAIDFLQMASAVETHSRPLERKP